MPWRLCLTERNSFLHAACMQEWVFTLIAVNGHLSAVSLPVNAWWTGSELKQLAAFSCPLVV